MAESLSGGVLVVFLLIGALPASAATRYDSFASAVEVRPDATFEVTETISGTFTTPRHGIFRNIPYRYAATGGTSQTIGISVEEVDLNGEAEPYTETRQGDYDVIKIGDPDVTFSGPFSYTVRYAVSRAMLYHENSDELYWNVTGSDWDGTFPSVKTVVTVPGVAADTFSVSCYTGAYGSGAHDCDAQTSDGMVAVGAHEFLTVSVAFPKGIVAAPSAFDKVRWFLEDNGIIALAAAIPLLSLVGLTAYWFRYGRDKKPKTIMAEYEPPEGLSPAEVSVLVHAQFANRDFSATIVDLAVRGYLVIVDEETSTLGFKSHTFVLRKKKSADATLKLHEREIVEKFFEGGDECVISSAQNRAVRSARQNCENYVNDQLAGEGYFVGSPKRTKGLFAGLGGALFLIVFVFQGAVENHPEVILLFFSLMVTAGLFALFAKIMPRRGPRGDVAYAKALGFKLYLETAEKYRVRWQEQEGIFEKFLPYAMVFGVADKWAKALADVAREQPDWYVGNFAVWNAMNFTSRMDTFSSAAAAVAAPRSSGGGGGGGFSGGGFGGGGGGSW